MEAKLEAQTHLKSITSQFHFLELISEASWEVFCSQNQKKHCKNDDKKHVGVFLLVYLENGIQDEGPKTDEGPITIKIKNIFIRFLMPCERTEEVNKEKGTK